MLRRWRQIDLRYKIGGVLWVAFALLWYVQPAH